jgi:hypothetical protein
LFGLFEVGDLHPQERPGKLNFGTGERRKPTSAYDPANRTLPADKSCLDRHAILQHHKIRDQAWAAWEIYGADQVARLMNDLATRPDPRLQIGVQDCSVCRPKGPQQIVAA